MPLDPKGEGAAAAKGEGSTPPYGPSPQPPLEVALMEQAQLDPAPARLPEPVAAGRRRSAGGCGSEGMSRAPPARAAAAASLESSTILMSLRVLLRLPLPRETGA
jgi:hypothetical protein